MPKPTYFDSQAQAAAALNVEIEVLRQAKRDGCTAFRSGRVYREPLVAWLAQRRQSPGTGRPGHEAHQLACVAPQWKNRREILFELMETVHQAYADGAIASLAEYRVFGTATMKSVRALATAWKLPASEYDAPGHWQTWLDILAGVSSRANG